MKTLFTALLFYCASSSFGQETINLSLLPVGKRSTNKSAGVSTVPVKAEYRKYNYSNGQETFKPDSIHYSYNNNSLVESETTITMQGDTIKQLFKWYDSKGQRIRQEDFRWNNGKKELFEVTTLDRVYDSMGRRTYFGYISAQTSGYYSEYTTTYTYSGDSCVFIDRHRYNQQDTFSVDLECVLHQIPTNGIGYAEMEFYYKVDGERKVSEKYSSCEFYTFEFEDFGITGYLKKGFVEDFSTNPSKNYRYTGSYNGSNYLLIQDELVAGNDYKSYSTFQEQLDAKGNLIYYDQKSDFDPITESYKKVDATRYTYNYQGENLMSLLTENSSPFTNSDWQKYDLYLYSGHTSVGIVRTQGETPRIYPNPVIDLINLDGVSFPLKYEIKSIDGKTISSGALLDREDIQVNEYTPGIYLLQIQNKFGSSVTRFVK